MKRSLFLLGLFFTCQLFSQTDSEVIKKIYDASLSNGQSYQWLDHLSNQIGSRLSGSLGAQRAVAYTKEELDKFHADIKSESIVDDDIRKIIDAFPKSAHPMGVLSSLTSALTAFNPSSVNVDSQEDMYKSVVRILGKFPVLVAWAMRKKQGLPLDYGDNSLGYVENVLKMMFKQPNEDYVQNKIIVNALNKLLILHA